MLKRWEVRVAGWRSQCTAAAGAALQSHKAGPLWLHVTECPTPFLGSVLSPRWDLFWFLLLVLLSYQPKDNQSLDSQQTN